MSKTQNIITWVPSALLAAAFIAAGAGKLAGVEMLHLSFANMGLPAWFGYFIGAAEVAGGLGLLLPRLASSAAAGLTVIMLGAIGYHLAFDPISAAIPAIVLGALTVFVGLRRRPQSIVFATPSATAAH